MNTSMKLAIEVVVNGVRAAGESLRGLGQAFKEGLRDGAAAELARTGKSLDELVKQANEARKALDLRPHAEIHGEIGKVQAAYASLRDSGVASAGEVAQAYLRAQERIIDLKHQTNGLSEAFGKVKASAAAVAAGFAGDAAAVGKAFDFEKATVQIDKLANLGPEALARVRTEIRELAKEIPIPAEGLAKIGESAAQLNLPVEDYKAFISLVAKSASAFDLPVQAAGDAFGKLNNNFRLSLPELGLVADSFNLLADSIANVKEGDLLNFTERLSAQGTGLLHVGTSWGRSAFAGLARVASEATPVGALKALAAGGGGVAQAGASGADVYLPAHNLRAELARGEDLAVFGAALVAHDFDATASQTAFTLPIGWEIVAVYAQGALKREGARARGREQGLDPQHRRLPLERGVRGGPRRVRLDFCPGKEDRMTDFTDLTVNLAADLILTETELEARCQAIVEREWPAPRREQAIRTGDTAGLDAFFAALGAAKDATRADYARLANVIAYERARAVVDLADADTLALYAARHPEGGGA